MLSDLVLKYTSNVVQELSAGLQSSGPDAQASSIL